MILKKSAITVTLILLLCCMVSGTVCASDTLADSADAESSLLDEFDFKDLNQGLKKLLPENKLTFQNLFDMVKSGDFEQIRQTFLQTISDQFFYELRYHKRTFVQIIFTAVIAAIFTNFSNAFRNRQISEISFYVLYLLLLSLCLNSFQLAVDVAEAELEHILTFMQILCPTYLLAVAIAVGSSTSIVFYQIVLFLIYLVELVVISILIPSVHIYIMVQLMNYMTEEETFTQLAELIEKLIVWTLKAMTALVIGINLIQRLLAPALDHLKRSALTRSAEAIPAIGDAMSGTTEVLLGSAVVIKNSIGISGALICVMLLMVPLLKLGFMVIMFKLASAVTQPISDKRITGCLTGISKGGELLLRILYTVTVLFLVTIAIIASTTHV
ncbi:MAG: stage III sporulation protein AE [Hespellia sp.]|nr:stage III sporulation protein AE [Hespellia sp.]